MFSARPLALSFFPELFDSDAPHRYMLGCINADRNDQIFKIRFKLSTLVCNSENQSSYILCMLHRASSQHPRSITMFPTFVKNHRRIRHVIILGNHFSIGTNLAVHISVDLGKNADRSSKNGLSVKLGRLVGVSAEDLACCIFL